MGIVEVSWFSVIFLFPQIEWSGAYCFCPVYVFVCLFIYLSAVNFNLHYNF